MGKLYGGLYLHKAVFKNQMKKVLRYDPLLPENTFFKKGKAVHWKGQSKI